MGTNTPMLMFSERNGGLINQNKQKLSLRGEFKDQGGGNRLDGRLL